MLHHGRMAGLGKLRHSIAAVDERRHWADSEGKHRVAGAAISVLNIARAPFFSGFAHLLRCRKDLG
jgi:hypothetical protein